MSINTIFYYMSLYTLSFLMINNEYKTGYIKFIICYLCSIFMFGYGSKSVLLLHIFMIFFSAIFISKNIQYIYINLYCITLSASIIMLVSFLLKFILYKFYPLDISIELSYLICFICIYPIYKVMLKFKLFSKKITNSSIIMIYPIIYFIMLFLLSVYININNNFNYLYRLIDIIILSTMIIIYIIVSIFIILKNKRIELDRKELNNLMEYVSIIDENYNRLRHFKHDLNNILLTLDTYIYNENIKGLKKYYSNLTNYIHHELKDIYIGSEGLSYIENIPLKSILLAKINLSNDKNISLEILIHQKFNISDKDTINICRILGILIDNAIEETEKLLDIDKRIKIIFFNDKQNHLKSIKIINKYREEMNNVDLTKMNITSNKGEDHGLGLKEVRNIIKHNKKLSFLINQSDQYIETILQIKETK